MFGAQDNQIVHELPLSLDLLQHVMVHGGVWELTSDDFTEQYSVTVDVYFGCLWWGENIRVNARECFWGSVDKSSLP